ncbi:dUTP diphosphatase [Bacillus sp. Gen3]|nr:dUTP diphosphatase [Bacillus sp. Gen3]
MNLKPLFETQKVLRDRIRYNEPDRFRKLILALLVEIGECANEWRGFKFWSQNQLPNTYAQCEKCGGLGWYYYNPPINEKTMCECFDNPKNPLLEEYVDGLHFVLELGIEINITPIACDLYYKAVSIDKQFIGLYKYVLNLLTEKTAERYIELLMVYVGLGDLLGFTWEQIEQAYYNKNKINHERQENGY